MKLDIYMKSGNVIRVDDVGKWKIESTGDEITSIEISRTTSKSGCRGFILASLCLPQIEAIVEL